MWQDDTPGGALQVLARGGYFQVRSLASVDTARRTIARESQPTHCPSSVISERCSFDALINHGHAAHSLISFSVLKAVHEIVYYFIITNINIASIFHSLRVFP